MDKKRIIGIILGALLLCSIGIKFYLDYKDNKDNKVVATEDAKKFKEEYESLNGQKTSSGKDYFEVNIEQSNPIVYKTDDEIAEVLENGTGIIYFGFKTCPWCRSMVETLLSSAKENKLDKVYYVDVLDIRSSFSVENKKLVETKKGTDGYYKILEYLDEYLSEYILEEKYDTKEKRLYAPTVVAIKDGKIVDIHEGTLDSQEDPYKGLTEEEKKELKKIFNKMIEETKNTVCDEEGAC